MTNTELGYVAAGGILGGMVTTMSICMIIFYVLIVVAEWKIFTKAGEEGWKSLIPIYNIYILYKISGLSFLTWFIVPCLVIPFCAGFISSIIPVPQFITSWVVIIVSLVAAIKEICALADSFGKGTGFKVGMFFLPNIFTLILGFGSAEYQGPAAQK